MNKVNYFIAFLILIIGLLLLPEPVFIQKVRVECCKHDKLVNTNVLKGSNPKAMPRVNIIIRIMVVSGLSRFISFMKPLSLVTDDDSNNTETLEGTDAEIKTTTNRLFHSLASCGNT